MQTKRLISLLLVLVMAVSLLAGCTSRKTGAEAKEETGKISSSMFLWDRSMLKEFSPWLEEKFPDIEFTFVQSFNTIEYYKDLLARGSRFRISSPAAGSP